MSHEIKAKAYKDLAKHIEHILRMQKIKRRMYYASMASLLVATLTCLFIIPFSFTSLSIGIILAYYASSAVSNYIDRISKLFIQYTQNLFSNDMNNYRELISLNITNYTSKGAVLIDVALFFMLVEDFAGFDKALSCLDMSLLEQEVTSSEIKHYKHAFANMFPDKKIPEKYTGYLLILHVVLLYKNKLNYCVDSEVRSQLSSNYNRLVQAMIKRLYALMHREHAAGKLKDLIALTNTDNRLVSFFRDDKSNKIDLSKILDFLPNDDNKLYFVMQVNPLMLEIFDTRNDSFLEHMLSQIENQKKQALFDLSGEKEEHKYSYIKNFIDSFIERKKNSEGINTTFLEKYLLIVMPNTSEDLAINLVKQENVDTSGVKRTCFYFLLELGFYAFTEKIAETVIASADEDAKEKMRAVVRSRIEAIEPSEDTTSLNKIGEILRTPERAAEDVRGIRGSLTA